MLIASFDKIFPARMGENSLGELLDREERIQKVLDVGEVNADSTYDHALKLLDAIGFQVVHYSNHEDMYTRGLIHYTLLWKDGALVECESYNFSPSGKVGINQITLHGNIASYDGSLAVLPAVVDWGNYQFRTSPSNRWITGGTWEIRHGVLKNLALLGEMGRLLDDWLHCSGLHLICFAESGGEPASDGKIAKLPPALRRMIREAKAREVEFKVA